MFRTRSSRACVAAAMTAALTLLASPAARAADPATPAGVLMIAHRGSVDHAPEHTLAAIDQAVADHADRLSIDVHLTKDGVPVVIHDFDLRRTTDVEQKFPGRSSWPVQDFTLAQIKTLDAGSWYPGGAYTGSRVLTFDELLTELENSPTGLTVEAKNPATYGGKSGIGDAIMAAVQRHPAWAQAVADASGRLVVESFPDATTGWSFLDEMHAAYPTLPLVLEGYTVVPQDIADHPYVRELDVYYKDLTSELLTAAHEHNLPVGTWTVNASADIQGVLTDGVDAVTSDQPDLLRSILREEGKTWTGTTWPAAPPTSLVDMSAPSTASAGGRVVVTARPRTASGDPIPWQTVAFQSKVGGVWETLSSNATDSGGAAVSSLPVNDNMRVRVVSAGRVSAERGVTAVIKPVVLPAGAPSPSLRVAAQSRPTTSGADARVTQVSSGIWRAMSGHSWRTGCPVGRSGLRTLRVSYWGFDGFRHRGELVVARGSAYQLARVFTRLYAKRLPIRSLHRLESFGDLGTAVGRATRAGASFGYACQRVPGDGLRVGSHARGTVVTLNPWENPTSVSGRGVPNSWWLSRTRSLGYVHASTNPVLRAFAAEGFAWDGKYGKYADFRDVR